MGAESERVAGFGRLEDGLRQAGDWYRWGPYVSEQDRAGRLLCGKDLSLPGRPDILVTGDLMCLDKLPGGRRGRHAVRPVRGPQDHPACAGPAL